MCKKYYERILVMPMEPIPFRHYNPAGLAYRRGWVDEAVAAIEAD